MKRFEIKICGITRRCDAELAAELGADYLGFVCVADSRRFVPNTALPHLTRNLAVKKVGVFVNASPDYIREAIALGSLDVVQLHGNESAAFAASLKGVEVWKAFTLPDAAAMNFPAARLLIDSAHPGSGERCNWQLARELATLRPVMLAGGIDAANAQEALEQVNPAGLDLASGVEESPGIKSEEKLRKLFTILNQRRVKK